jgi:hypothetical protein
MPQFLTVERLVFLSIVREIVSNRGGSVRFVPPSDGWKASLEVILP